MRPPAGGTPGAPTAACVRPLGGGPGLCGLSDSNASPGAAGVPHCPARPLCPAGHGPGVGPPVGGGRQRCAPPAAARWRGRTPPGAGRWGGPRRSGGPRGPRPGARAPGSPTGARRGPLSPAGGVRPGSSTPSPWGPGGPQPGARAPAGPTALPPAVRQGHPPGGWATRQPSGAPAWSRAPRRAGPPPAPRRVWSRTLGLRIMFRDFCQSLCVVPMSRLSALATGLQSLVQAT